MFRLAQLAKITGAGSAMFVSNMFCFSQKTDLPYLEVVQYNANDPIEDRFSYSKLKSIKGFTASVFDGHGGNLVVLLLTYRQNMRPKILIDASMNDWPTI